MANKNNIEDKKKEKQVENKNVTSQSISTDDVHMTFYTGTTMLAVLIAAVSSMLSFIYVGKPSFYIIKSYFGGVYDDEQCDYVKDFVFVNSEQNKIKALSIATAVLLLIATVLTIFVVIKSVDALKKPDLLVSVFAFVASFAALVVDISSRISASKTVDEYINGVNGQVAKDRILSMSDYAFFALIASVICLFLMVIGVATGKAKWEKTGRTY